MRKVFLILSVIFLIGIVSAQNYQYGMMNSDGQFYPIGQYGYGMMGMMFGSYGWSMMFFGWAFMGLVSVALVLLIIWLIKQLKKKR